MPGKLQFDFSIDKENKRITVQRAFDAPVQRVWAAWTERDRLDQWWAPKPFLAKTKTMYFKEGGYWHYVMIGPGGEEHWCRADYLSIQTLKSFSWRDAFCDETGTIVQDFPRSTWTNDFNQQGQVTVVTNLIEYEELLHMEKYLDMGFEEGYKAGLTNLDEFLKE